MGNAGAGERPALANQPLTAAGTPASPANQPASPVYYIKAEGIVNPVMAEYIIKGIRGAASDGAGAVVIQIDTPGGLDLSMRDIVKEMLSSAVPVIVYVAPAGARAASAGVFITYAADIAAMAGGTNIGSAHPVQMGGEKMDETMVKKVENDAVAYIRSIAKKRRRNEGWAEKAVRESVNVTAAEALRLNVIDMVADTRQALLSSLDGRKVETPAGAVTLRTKGADVKEMEMDLRHRVLDVISNPNVAYILMMIGVAGLFFELSNPGAVLPGVAGAICLVLAFYAFQTLPVNYAGFLLIALAFVFFVLEIKVVSFGLLTVAGVASLVLGSLMLFRSPLPFMRLSLWVLMPTVVLVTLVLLTAMYFAVRIHRKRPASGMEGIVGTEGTAVDAINPGSSGRVFVSGEYWDAAGDEPIESGARVKVVEIQGLRLKVVKT
ncbi:MAG: nodulation protein NfeD [Deltaproteobacteria bacterium]|nr:nodulation protein NfeD [Deltaproteobacteria bacterium]